MNRTIRWKLIIHYKDGRMENHLFGNKGQAIDFLGEDTEYYEDTVSSSTIERYYGNVSIEREILCEKILTPITS